MANEPDRHQFQSRAIMEATYYPGTQTLDVVFKTGRSYTLSGVPPDTWEGMKASSSPGSYFNDYLKGMY